MRGISIGSIALSLLVAACSFGPQPKPKWSPYAPARAENWHSGKLLIASYDSDGDGTVTRGELEAGLRQYFRQADTNGDGRLDPDEVAAANARRMRIDKSTAIPLIDWNGDGYVDFDEFANGVRSEFDELDLDGDGKVTPEEFRKAP